MGVSIVDRSLVGLLDGDLVSRLVAIARLFVISQTVWELWLIKNNQVFQGKLTRFLATKVEILMIERMKALCYAGLMNKSKIRITRSIHYIAMPKSWASIDGSIQGNDE